MGIFEVMKQSIVILLLAAAVSAGCGSRPEQRTAPAAYPVLSVSASDEEMVTSYPATLQGRQVVEIRPRVSGTLYRIEVGEGRAVRKGQTLFVIDQAPYQAALSIAESAVETAQTQLETARLTLQSKEMLRRNEVISAYELQLAENAVALAEATLAEKKAARDNAAHELSYTLVTSPVDGVAGMIPYRVGALVGPSDAEPLVTVSDDSVVNAYFSMGERQVLQLQQKHGSLDDFLRSVPPLSLELSDGSAYPLEGRLTAISGVVRAETGTVTLRADFPNPDHLLRSGNSARVQLKTVRKGCLVIPAAATYEIQNKRFVFRVLDGKAAATQVTATPLPDGQRYIIESGLEEGDQVIAEGAGLVKDGTPVKPQG